MTIRDIFLKTRKINIERLIYSARWNRIDDYYYDIPTSVDILEKIVFYQNHEDETSTYIFLKDLFEILDMRIPKCNCMVILSPPNAGKNFFFDCVINSMINFGQMGSFNKYSGFPIQECVNRRVILWNEPNFEPAAEETLKCLFGGDACNAKVKYQGDVVINKTPISLFAGHPANHARRLFGTGY